MYGAYEKSLSEGVTEWLLALGCSKAFCSMSFGSLVFVYGVERLSPETGSGDRGSDKSVFDG